MPLGLIGDNKYVAIERLACSDSKWSSKDNMLDLGGKVKHYEER